MMGARKWHFRTLKVQLSPSKSLTITSQKCNFCAQKRRFLATFMRNRQQNRISFHETYHPSRFPFSKIPKIGCQDICRKINTFNLKSAPNLTKNGYGILCQSSFKYMRLLFFLFVVKGCCLIVRDGFCKQFHPFC